MGISCDSQHSHRMWSNSLGTLRYPLLADFYPHGEVSKAYGVFNDNNGAPRRAIVIIDKDGITRFKHEYASGSLPIPTDILAELDKLS